MPTQREWTILLYMAGDNGKIFETKNGNFSLMAGMTESGERDLAEVEVVGTTDQVAVLAQFDTLGDNGTMRLELYEGRSTVENIVERIPETNTGDPSELSKFIVWGMSRCPANRTMLVLWNHGTGWKDDDFYEGVRSVRSATRKPNRKVSKPPFRTTAPTILRKVKRAQTDGKRAILADDTSMDFLTNTEMSQALRVAEFAQDEADVAAIFQDKDRLKELMTRGTEGSLRHLNIIGMDACLMAMIEVQYQVRKFADVMVGSQEVEPLRGWPYTEILQELNLRPTSTSAELAALIVDKYAESYVSTSRKIPNITQSAIDLSKMGEAALLIKDFSEALARDFFDVDDLYLKDTYRDAQAFATDRNYAFDDPEYLDLISFLQALLKGYKGRGDQPDTLKAGQNLLDWLLSPQSPIIKNAAIGSFKDRAYGISIYVPMTQPSPLYKELDFAAAGWLKTIDTINKPQS